MHSRKFKIALNAAKESPEAFETLFKEKVLSPNAKEFKPHGNALILALITAIKDTLLPPLLKVLFKYNVDLEVKDILDFRPLSNAAYYGKVDAVKCLLEQKAQVNVVPKPAICTALTGDAKESVKLKIIDMLLSYGADINIKDNSIISTPFFNAVSKGLPLCLDLLIHQNAEIVSEALYGPSMKAKPLTVAFVEYNEKVRIFGNIPMFSRDIIKARNIFELLTKTYLNFLLLNSGISFINDNDQELIEYYKKPLDVIIGIPNNEHYTNIKHELTNILLNEIKSKAKKLEQPIKSYILPFLLEDNLMILPLAQIVLSYLSAVGVSQDPALMEQLIGTPIGKFPSNYLQMKPSDLNSNSKHSMHSIVNSSMQLTHDVTEAIKTELTRITHLEWKFSHNEGEKGAFLVSDELTLSVIADYLRKNDIAFKGPMKVANYENRQLLVTSTNLEKLRLIEALSIPQHRLINLPRANSATSSKNFNNGVSVPFNFTLFSKMKMFAKRKIIHEKGQINARYNNFK